MKPAHDESWTWKSWIDSANKPGCGFPLQNLPFCAFQAEDGSTHLGVGIGDVILDLRACAEHGLFDSLPHAVRLACSDSALNELMGCGRQAATLLRGTLMALLREGAEAVLVGKLKERLTPFLHPMRSAILHLPVRVGNYTDFYASAHHAANVGRLFRPDGPLLPNYKFVPIGYGGRASSIVASETPVVRPRGQTMLPSAAAPAFGPSRQLDYEVEVGAYMAGGNALGEPIDIAEAEQHIFGFSLVNDWSARDIQAWEYQPLGPFLGKSFATSVSPWVVTADALAPFRVPLALRPAGDPEPLPYLCSPKLEMEAIDMQLEVHLATAAMRARSEPPVRLSSANLRELYWSFPQMLAHHTSNGCNLLAGDLLASGTVSGPEEGTQGSLLEITRRGAVPLTLPDGETRGFLEDGDEIILSGACRRDGLPAISLGECRGIVLPANA